MSRGLLLLGALLGILLACKSSSKREKTDETDGRAPAPTATRPASTTPPVPTVPAKAHPTDYDLSSVNAISDQCVDAQVVLLAVTKAHYQHPTFQWRHVRQVLLANPDFQAVPAVGGRTAGQLAFAALEHRPTQGVALVAKCSTAQTCRRFAAAYRTVVPTGRPEVTCGRAPTLGDPVPGGPVLPPGGAADALPKRGDVVSQCIRLAACQAARDHYLDGDIALECQRTPSKVRVDCASKPSCGAALDCADM